MADFRLSAVRTLVLLGAHPDDIEIGAGGLLLLLAEARPGLRVHYVLFSGSPERHAEAEAAAEGFLPGARIDFVFHSIPDGRLPAHWNEAKEVVEGWAIMEYANLEQSVADQREFAELHAKHWPEVTVISTLRQISTGPDEPGD